MAAHGWRLIPEMPDGSVTKTGAALELATSINYTMKFLADETNVYYFDDVRGQGSFGPVALMKVPKNGGPWVEIDTGNAGWVSHQNRSSPGTCYVDKLHDEVSG